MRRCQVADNGLIGSIMTLYEITDGDLSHTTGTSGIPPHSAPIQEPSQEPRASHEPRAPSRDPRTTHHAPRTTRLLQVSEQPAHIAHRISLRGYRTADRRRLAEFRQLHPALLRRALDTLVKKGKAQLLKGEGEVGDGVRFL
jgi:hypothetical protein